jgi:hypothetical protein
MMTRETKVGLVVACSFLCLVGLVLGGKLSQNWRGTHTREPSSEDLRAANDKAGPDKKDAKQSPELEELPPDAKPPLEPIVKTSGGDSNPLPTSPMVSEPVDAQRPGDAEPPRTKITKRDPNPDDLPTLPPDPPKPATEVLPLPPLPEQNDESEKKSTKTKDKTAPEVIPETPAAKADGDPRMSPVRDPSKKSDSDALPIDPPPVKKTADAVIEPSPAPAAIERPTTPSDATSIDLPPKRVGPDGKPRTAPVVPTPPDGLGEEESRVALGKIDSETPRGAPRVGEPPRATAPAIAVPASRIPAKPAAAGPRVESYDEETYRPRPDDTFASISKRFYQSDKYAQALLLFNREHPRAGDGIRRDPPTLSGQAVYIPPIGVLERRHADVIPNIEPAPTAPSPVGRDVPRGDGAPSAAGRAATRAYQVAAGGETMLQIARTQLGNSDRWREIDKLNPGWKAEFPIPAGTTLILPADPRGGP